jgi:hypothetical protein
VACFGSIFFLPLSGASRDKTQPPETLLLVPGWQSHLCFGFCDFLGHSVCCISFLPHSHFRQITIESEFRWAPSPLPTGMSCLQPSRQVSSRQVSLSSPFRKCPFCPASSLPGAESISSQVHPVKNQTSPSPTAALVHSQCGGPRTVAVSLFLPVSFPWQGCCSSPWKISWFYKVVCALQVAYSLCGF